MKIPLLRELIAWTLVATLTAVHLLGTGELEHCTKQLEWAQAQMRAKADLLVAKDSGPLNRRDAGVAESALPDSAPTPATLLVSK